MSTTINGWVVKRRVPRTKYKGVISYREDYLTSNGEFMDRPIASTVQVYETQIEAKFIMNSLSEGGEYYIQFMNEVFK